jgi:hypothetical protein
LNVLAVLHSITSVCIFKLYTIQDSMQQPIRRIRTQKST